MSLESVGKFTKSRIVESGNKDLCLNNNQINQFIVKSWHQLTTIVSSTIMYAMIKFI